MKLVKVVYCCNFFGAILALAKIALLMRSTAITEWIWISVKVWSAYPRKVSDFRGLVQMLKNNFSTSLILLSPATTTTTRFPLFQAFTVKPAVGKAAQWLCSEILMIFVFFYFLDWTSESWEKWILVRLHSDDGDADHRRTTLSKTKILQTESNFQ